MTSAAARMRAHRQREAAGRRAADYQRAYRARVKKGRAVLRIEVEVGATGDMLQANGFLQGDWNLENPREVARGLERLIEEMNSGHDHGMEFYLE